MKKFLIIASALATTMLTAQAQNTITDVLSEIEQNNTSLKALKETYEAAKIGNRTDLNLPGPEFEFNYLWGNAAGQGNRTDLKATQEFDFATLLGKKSAVATQQNALIDIQYKAERIAVLTEAKLLCIDLICANAQLQELNVRYENANEIVAAQNKRLSTGDGNQLELNNVKMALATIESEKTRLEAERDALIADLTRLNGGNKVDLTQTVFPAIELPANFEAWYAEAESKSPTLAYVHQEVTLSDKQVALNKSLGLPSITVGYMSEKTTDQYFKGVTVGVSIPLWSNHNKVRQAETARNAAQLRAADARVRFYSQLEILYNKTIQLRKAADLVQSSIRQSNNTRLLKIAYNEGQITVIDYLLEIGLYYDSVSRALNAECDFQKSYCQLTSVEL